MKKTLFVCSHYGSGSDDLVESLNKIPEIQIWNTQTMYKHPFDLDYLHSLPHKINSYQAIYGDHLLVNAGLSNHFFLSHCKFILVIRNPKDSLSSINNSNILQRKRYYCFRLRRLCELANKTNCIILNYEKLINGFGQELISNYLNIKRAFNIITKNELNVCNEEIEDANESYERYYYYLKNLKVPNNL